MSRLVRAIYEQGSLKPLESMDLAEGDRVWIKLVPASEQVSAKLTALDELVESCDELTADQWRAFEEASARRPLFPSSFRATDGDREPTERTPWGAIG